MTKRSERAGGAPGDPWMIPGRFGGDPGASPGVPGGSLGGCLRASLGILGRSLMEFEGPRESHVGSYRGPTSVLFQE